MARRRPSPPPAIDDFDDDALDGPATPEQQAELAALIAANGGLPEISFEELVERAHDVRATAVREGLSEARRRGEELSPELVQLSEKWARHELTDHEFIDAVYAHLGFVGPETEQ